MSRGGADRAGVVLLLVGLLLVAAVARVAAAPGSASAFAPLPQTSGPAPRGVNLSGAEFGVANNWQAAGPTLPGTYGVHYIYPSPAELDYYRSRGFTLVRLPFRWERLQRKLNGPLDPAELGRLDAFVAAARDRGMQVILDPHNYARYYDQLIGSDNVPNAAFADFWRKLARHYQGESAIWAYGLINEPADTAGRWPAAAQAAVDAIRSVDSAHLILVPGDGWSSAADWARNNQNLSIRDPANNFLYEAHQYFDADRSGKYAASYDAAGAHPDVGVELVRPFVDWLRSRQARGFLGEYGAPDGDSRWLTVLERLLAYLDANAIGSAYWAGGPWWGDYPLSIEPRAGQDRPQLAVVAPGGASPISSAGTGPAAAGCFFTLGFRLLHDLVPARVGDCLEDETHNPSNGDGLQRTSGGLLVWRKADNWTAFTDGATTWLNGPCGLQLRSNQGPLFSWEGRVGAVC
jgi:aryl-phospho-beta-D-glucosidase BglC (GH1 family)